LLTFNYIIVITSDHEPKRKRKKSYKSGPQPKLTIKFHKPEEPRCKTKTKSEPSYCSFLGAKASELSISRALARTPNNEKKKHAKVLNKYN